MRSTSFLIFLTLITAAQATLTATFTSAGKTVETRATLPALHVSAGEPSAPGLAPGAFTATFKGNLNIPKRYRLTFSVESEGQFALKVDGEDVPFTDGLAERLRVNPGEVPIEISYTSPESGAGSFRLYWMERSEFPRVAVPAEAFTMTDAPLDAAHLFASHNCIQCHAAGDLGQNAMPELKYAGPNLTNIGDRTHEAWLTRWISQPEKLKPTTTMPGMVDHTKPEGAQAAADLGAYLATIGVGKEVGTAPDPALAQSGGAIFHNLGCVACHTKPDALEPDYDNDRIPLNNIAAKFKGGALISFLKNPQEHHAAIKMPNFGFSDEEASALAAYLTKTSTGRHTPDPSEFPPGDVVRGKALVTSLNCAACHEGLEASTSTAPKLADLKNWSTRGCLSPDENRGKSPRLQLTAEEKKALTPTVLPQVEHDTVEAYTTRQIEALNCTSCHVYNGQASLLSLTHAESKGLLDHITGHDERLIQSKPPLTHMGAMLHTTFTEKMLLGKVEPRPRPWLDMRMPAFPLHAQRIALGLAEHHGLTASSPDEMTPDTDQVAIGKTLVTNYACNGCHGINDQKPAAFEVQGINFGMVHSRLRSGYFHEWMDNPLRLVPETKMPQYPAFPGILDGDKAKQFEAIRQYLHSINKK
ncbi:c-type cytochrome [Verrucomicrobiaceae bacterium 227]